MMYSAGAGHKIVGVVAYSDYPNAAKTLPNVGHYNAINLEKIIQLNPDLILAWNTGNQPKDLERLHQLGFKIDTSNPKSLSDIPNEIRKLGQTLNTQSIAEPEAQRLEAILQQQTLRNVQRPSVSVFYQIWNDPLITVNQDQFIGQIITLCGARNSFADLPTLTASVNFESVLERNPDVILLGGLSAVQTGWLKAWQAWPSLNAVASQRIYPMHADTYQRPTARLIEGIEAFCNTLHQTP